MREGPPSVVLSTQILENREFNAEELLGILTKVVEEFCAFARKLIHVRRGLIDAVV